MIGTIVRISPPNPVGIQILKEFPGLLRIDEQAPGKPKTTGIDDKGPWKGGATLASDESEMLEALLNDSTEEFLAGQASGYSSRFIGSRFRPDAGKGPYSGPFYDVYQVIDTVKGQGRVLSQPKRYYFNSDSLLLQRVRYQVLRGSARIDVETQASDWKSIAGQLTPTKIRRTENGQVVWTISITSVVFGPHGDDGIFNGQR